MIRWKKKVTMTRRGMKIGGRKEVEKRKRQRRKQEVLIGRKKRTSFGREIRSQKKKKHISE